MIENFEKSKKLTNLHQSVNEATSEAKIKHEPMETSENSHRQQQNADTRGTDESIGAETLTLPSDSRNTLAHSGSPGFLRGRGRGRPKLIGG